MTLIVAPTAENIARAAELLQRGELVAFPTETVYGLGADASNPAAVARIFAAKGRPQDHPVIVHLPGVDCLGEWACDISEAARLLASRFWPGPLTLVLKRAPRVGDSITGGQDTVGLRVPSHPVARELLKAFGSGVAAPSANRFGRVSPTTAQHVEEEFASREESPAMILDGGAAAVGIESTIVDLSRARPALLRPGGIGLAELESALGAKIETIAGTETRAPGMLEAHYAPATPLRVLPREALVSELNRGRSNDTAVLAFVPPNTPSEKWIAAASDAKSYAHDLYANLRKLDALGCERMLIEQPPQDLNWAAINDRLRRAARGSA